MIQKNFLITGGTDGIGLALVKKLIKENHTLFIVGKDFAKGSKIINELKYTNIDFFQCDLSEKDEIKKLLNKLKNIKTLDVLINNAGAIYDKRLENSYKIEKTFALNHLSYFHLSLGLLEKLEKSKNGRIINVTSNAHKRYNLDLADLENKKNYNGWKAYCRSKLLNIFFTYAFNKKLSTKVKCNCFHPGFVNSNFGNNNKTIFRFFVQIVKNLFANSVTNASGPLYNLANLESYDNVSGKYYFKEKERLSSKYSYNSQIALEVWNKSLRYID